MEKMLANKFRIGSIIIIKNRENTINLRDFSLIKKVVLKIGFCNFVFENRKIRREWHMMGGIFPLLMLLRL
ncbi:MAG: hypothetical protein KAT28_01355 [Candidatus Aenigmarchaeota archaeon]|nr:hypothetical protein [Candidatus Aenigmarchaeota archaeon]